MASARRVHECPQCGEPFALIEDAGEAMPPFPSDWHAYVVHEHETSSDGTMGPGMWQLNIFHHPKRARYPDGAKVLMLAQKEQRKAVIAAKQTKKASAGKRSHTLA